MEDRTKGTSLTPAGTSKHLIHKFHFTVVGGIQTGRDNMTDTSNVANIHNGHPFVDLGLPSGLLWATCNVGATSPEQAGLYFAWGETTGYSMSGWDSVVADQYKNKKYESIPADLTLEQDAAHTYMGGKWRMPTKTEYQELIDNCTCQWIKYYGNHGAAGMMFTSKINGESVFFRASGRGMAKGISFANSIVEYCSSSIDSKSFAWGFRYLTNKGVICSLCNHYGRTIRAVCER